MCRAISLTRALQITPRGNHLDTLCGTLEKKMQFAEGERDIVMYVDPPPPQASAVLCGIGTRLTTP